MARGKATEKQLIKQYVYTQSLHSFYTLLPHNNSTGNEYIVQLELYRVVGNLFSLDKYSQLKSLSSPTPIAPIIIVLFLVITQLAFSIVLVPF